MSPVTIAGIIGLLICITVPDCKKSRKIVCILVCICFILQAGTRDYINSTNDTYNYYQSYKNLLPFNIQEIIHQTTFTFFDDYQNRDPAYTIFVKLTQEIYPDFRFLLLIVASIISIPITWIIYRFTNSLPGIVISVMLYEALFAGFFETGIRQTIAMGLIYFSLPYVMERKWIKHYVILTMASLFHSSAIIFIPFYFLVTFKYTKKFLIWVIVLTPIFMTIAPALILFLGEGTMFENYANTKVDNLGTPVFSALLFIVSIGTWIYRKHFDENKIDDRILIAALICSLILMPSTWVNSNFIRLVFYYLVFLMPLIPHLISDAIIGKQIRNLATMATGLVLIIIG